MASPLGEWTNVECICDGDRITVKINGQTVNECYNVFPASGKILLENEKNEIYFRNLEIRPLPDGCHQTETAMKKMNVDSRREMLKILRDDSSSARFYDRDRGLAEPSPRSVRRPRGGRRPAESRADRLRWSWQRRGEQALLADRT